METLIEQYLTSLRVEGGLATNTLVAYRRDLRKLNEFLRIGGWTDPLAVSKDVFLEFLAF